MDLVHLRQTIKACSDDTRLRILNILEGDELTVKEMCAILGISQPTVSKHLARLRLAKIVVDKRVGNTVYYSFHNVSDSSQYKIATFFVSQFSDIDTFKEDKEKKRKLKGR